VKPVLKIGGQFVEFIIAIDFDRLPRGIEDDLAVAAGGSVGANLFEQIGADLPIKVVGKLAEEIGAGHAV